MRRPDFTVCYDEGRRFFSRRFMVFARRNPTLGAPWRMGVAVSKKIGVAVSRNRVKRVLREFFRLHQMLCPAGVDMVVVPKRGLVVADVGIANVTAELLPVLAEIERKLNQGRERAGADYE